MSVLFSRNRLHVGYRRMDWSDVWYEPDADTEGQNGSPEVTLYQYITGDATYREPMMGEVAWHPPFDPKASEADGKAYKDELHKRYLFDAWTYMAETNGEKIQRLEAEWHKPAWPRWQTWFKQAQKVKKRKLSAAAGNLARRKAKARQHGIPLDEVELSDEESDDPGYGSGEERVRVKKTARDMPPPPKPTKANAKRKAEGNGGNGRKPAAKKARPAARDRSANSDGGRSVFIPRMSGLVPNGARISSTRSSLDGFIAGDDQEADDEDERDWESNHPTPEPQPQPSKIIQAHDLNGLPTPLSTQRRRATSRTPNGLGDLPNDQLPPFNNWGAHFGAPGVGILGDNRQRGGTQPDAPQEDEEDGENIRVNGSNGRRSLTGGDDDEDDNEDDGRRRAAEFNGEFEDEDEAVRVALRASVALESNAGGYRDNEEELQRAVRASMAAEANDVRPSIEKADDVDDAEDDDDL